MAVHWSPSAACLCAARSDGVTRIGWWGRLAPWRERKHKDDAASQQRDRERKQATGATHTHLKGRTLPHAALLHTAPVERAAARLERDLLARLDDLCRRRRRRQANAGLARRRRRLVVVEVVVGELERVAELGRGRRRHGEARRRRGERWRAKGRDLGRGRRGGGALVRLRKGERRRRVVVVVVGSGGGVVGRGGLGCCWG